jgi:crossover junction endodeoxyribonuclease RusA
MQSVTLELPYPPSVNHYWGQSGKTRFIGKKGKEFRAAVVAVAVKDKVRSMAGRLSVHVNLYPPDRRKRDIDNVLKSLLDACEHAGCYVNDSQIDELHVIRKEIIKSGACFITILELP